MTTFSAQITLTESDIGLVRGLLEQHAERCRVELAAGNKHPFDFQETACLRLIAELDASICQGTVFVAGEGGGLGPHLSPDG